MLWAVGPETLKPEKKKPFRRGPSALASGAFSLCAAAHPLSYQPCTQMIGAKITEAKIDLFLKRERERAPALRLAKANPFASALVLFCNGRGLRNLVGLARGGTAFWQEMKAMTDRLRCG